MKLQRLLCTGLALAGLVLALPLAHGQRQMENLGRGVVAIQQPDGKVFISWRLLGTDPENIAFNLYRQSDAGAQTRGGRAPRPAAPNATAPGRVPAPDGAAVTTAPEAGARAGAGARGGRGGGAPNGPVKLNTEPLTGATCFVDANADLVNKTSYFVRPVLNGIEQAPSTAFVIAAGASPLPYLSIPLKTPAGYSPNDVSVGDLDGDGEYEFIVHMTGRGSDPAMAGVTSEPILQAYKLDGTLLWTINLGKNIRESAHATQFMVYDLDGDGKAELVCKTADGTTDGVGTVIGDPKADWVAKSGMATARDRTGSERDAEGNMITNPDGTHNFSFVGRILSGPEYLTVFEGLTGKALATTAYNPPLGKPELWGDAYGNRSERYLAGVAYLDGVRPSVVMCRGYYERTTLCAWDWRDGKLNQRWFFDSDDGTPGNEKYRGQGAHSLSVADVDGDGKDEIVYGAAVIDHDGKGLYSTGRGHGDALHVSDMDPDRPGLEVWMIHERPGPNSGGDLRDAKTGELLWGLPCTNDAGRGMAANIDPRYKGYQMWSAPSDGLYNAKGVKISDKKPRSCNFAVWWDGDLLREILNSNRITKWNWLDGTETPLLTAQGCVANNGTKSTPALSADLFGDWREEVIWPTADGRELRIYTTTIPTEHRLVTLMHDPQYRLAIAWQNVTYNQPPHPGFYLGEGMAPAPRPNITTVPLKL